MYYHQNDPQDHQHYFLFLASVMAVGVAVVVILIRLQQRGAANWPAATGWKRRQKESHAITADLD